MKTQILESYGAAASYLTERHHETILDNPACRIHMMIMIPASTSIGEAWEALFWAKVWTHGGEVKSPHEWDTKRYYSYNVAVKGDHLNSFLVTLYGLAQGYVFEIVNDVEGKENGR